MPISKVKNSFDMFAKSQTQYQNSAHRSYGVVFRIALMQLVFWGIACPMTFAPILKQMGSGVIGSSCNGLSESPVEEDGEPSSELFDVLKSVYRAGLTRHSRACCNLSRRHLLSRSRVDHAGFFLRDVHSLSRSEFYLRNGCGAALRC